MSNSMFDAIVNDVIVSGLVVGVGGAALVAYLNENLKVLRQSFLVASARRKLATQKPSVIKRGVMILLEIANQSPTRRQEMVDIIALDCFRRHFGRENHPPSPTPPEMIDLFRVAIRAVLSLPRADANEHDLNIDLHQLRLVALETGSIYLEKLNLKDVVLWGSEFIRVDFSRSSFHGSDLGGVLFQDCGLEDLDLEAAKLAYSPLDDRQTIFRGSHMARSNIEAATVLAGGPQVVFAEHTEVEQQRLEKLRSLSGGVLVQ